MEAIKNIHGDTGINVITLAAITVNGVMEVHQSQVLLTVILWLSFWSRSY
jgi:hypothetical protein